MAKPQNYHIQQKLLVDYLRSDDPTWEDRIVCMLNHLQQRHISETACHLRRNQRNSGRHLPHF